jgi:hypothetical protein
MTGSHGNESRWSTVDAKLKSIAEAAPQKPAWYAAWSRLGPESTEEERLAVYLAVRESGVLGRRGRILLGLGTH